MASVRVSQRSELLDAGLLDVVDLIERMVRRTNPEELASLQSKTEQVC